MLKRRFTAADIVKSVHARKQIAKDRYETVHVWFWQRVTKTESCWLWSRGHSKAGYGRVWFLGETRDAHRVAWEITYGHIPDNLFVCHTCDNPGCVRPEHLFIGTATDNVHDMYAKGREVSGRAKLNEQQVRSILMAYLNGVTPSLLAKQYQVDRSSVYNILYGKTWKHVTGGHSCL